MERKKKLLLYTGLLIAGLLFAFTIASNLARELAPWLWKKTPCTIQRAEISKTEPQSNFYRFSVLYQYQFDDQTFHSNQWRRRDVEPFDSYSALSDQTGRFLVLSSSEGRPQRSPLRERTEFCYVNADQPSQAVLRRENPVRILLLIFPLIMIVPAAIGLTRLLRPTAIPVVRRKLVVRTALSFVALGVIAFGLFLFMTFFVFGVVDVVRSAKWQPSTCRVIESYLHTDAAPTTGSPSNRTPGYRLRILFSYSFQGHKFLADRYDFVRWGTGGNRLTRILQNYPAEAEVGCFINPQQPYEAVLNREFTTRYLMGLIPLPIALAGLILFMVARRH